MSTSLPWLGSVEQRLIRMRQQGRLPTGLLLQGALGTGAEPLAGFVAQLALCRADAPACGVCRDCRMVEALQHPDFTWVRPLEDSKVIRVEQIRELTEALVLTAHAAGVSVAVLNPADAMNANAANALLKTLEEPRAGVTLVLVSAAPSRLPATILSRCQRLRVPTPTRAQALAWLAAQKPSADWGEVLDVLGNAPLLALDIDPAELRRVREESLAALMQARRGQLDLSATAEGWARGEHFELRLTCIENWLTTRIEDWAVDGRQTQPVQANAHLPDPGLDVNIVLLLRLLDMVYELKALRSTAINRGLALEQLLWQLVPRASRAAA
jgi:DNA polymerase-3 subunit delta'